MPDVVYLSDANEGQRGGDRFFRGVDLAIEVVSDDYGSHRRDHQEKVDDYAEGHIPEHWIVDPQLKRIKILSLADGASAYSESGVLTSGQTAESTVLKGFSVAVADVFAAARRKR